MSYENWVISIGTGSSQSRLIETASVLGYKILGVDRYPNKNLVDDYLEISTFNTEDVLSAVKNHRKRNLIKGVLARTSGPAVLTAAKVACELGLPGFSRALATVSVSKIKLVQLAKDYGVRCIDSEIHASKPILAIGNGWVIKPDQPVSGKLNVYFVNKQTAMSTAFDASHKESLNKKVLFQPFIPGRDIGLVMMVRDGECLWHFFYEEFVDLVDGRFKGRGVSAPLRNVHLCSINEMLGGAQTIVKKNKVTGFVFTSFRLASDGAAFLYELNLGLSGDRLVDKLFPSLWPNSNFFEMDVSLMTSVNVKIIDYKPAQLSVVFEGKLSVGADAELLLKNSTVLSK